MNLVDELHAIVNALRAAAIDYAVCGGIAVTIHGATRSTKDIDLVVRREDVDHVTDAIRPLGYKFVALPMVFDEGTPNERHVQRISKIVGADHLMVDLLLAEAAFTGALDDRIEAKTAEGSVSVVSRTTLLRMKQLANRPQDIADLEKLEASKASGASEASDG